MSVASLYYYIFLPLAASEAGRDDCWQMRRKRGKTGLLQKPHFAQTGCEGKPFRNSNLVTYFTYSMGKVPLFVSLENYYFVN